MKETPKFEVGQCLWLADPGALNPPNPFPVYVASVDEQWITFARSRFAEAEPWLIDRATMKLRNGDHFAYLSHDEAYDAIKPNILRQLVRGLVANRQILGSLSVSQLERMLAIVDEAKTTESARQQNS